MARFVHFWLGYCKGKRDNVADDLAADAGEHLAI